MDLKEELADDPLGRGYSGMTDDEAAVDLNTEYRRENRKSMATAEILDIIVDAELTALTAAKQTEFWRLLDIGEIKPFGPAGQIIIRLFGVSTTKTNFLVARKQGISRARELGFRRVRSIHVCDARL